MISDKFQIDYISVWKETSILKNLTENICIFLLLNEMFSFSFTIEKVFTCSGATLLCLFSRCLDKHNMRNSKCGCVSQLWVSSVTPVVSMG